ncbi:(deoxy)nucleoside triphosphate pyrophosphohydrolase [Marinifilum caeruleilacunae]|uniref:8-oxo-dGTP diphosphatase n=1 Tax=Marinifilum caeruleilacunae TaxID=2499076 RepID=A0ABX1WZY1_9BACT|nr:(deoxy)nucleoside triphosphate pyrophosphohydrolase [Marinifilum caeruleilacunae]NOU61418.1 (deoxy)nucleoside triphosphate pyrophosphohydrolase [Marinifilum caeruleilacunae]
MKAIPVCAAIIRKGDRILVAQRNHHDELGLKWEFPGGKLEPNETAEECMVRELFEEFGIQSKVKGFLGENTHDYGNKKVCLKAYFVEHLSGEFQIRVHQSVKWVHYSELKDLDWAPADIKLVELLLDHYGYRS